MTTPLGSFHARPLIQVRPYSHLSQGERSEVRFGNGNFLNDPITEPPASDYQVYPSRVMGWVVKNIVNHFMFRRMVHNIRGVSVENMENLRRLVNDPKIHLVIAPTHPGFGDVSALFSVLHQTTNRVQVVGNIAAFSVAGQFFKPVLKWLLSLVGYMPVHRDAGDMKAIRSMMKAMEEGGPPLLIFPEGTQSFQSESVVSLRSGVAQLSKRVSKRLRESKPDHRLVILPVGIRYSFTSPQHAQRMLRKHLRNWSEQLGIKLEQGSDSSEVQQLEAFVRKFMQNKLRDHHIMLPESADLKEMRSRLFQAQLAPVEKALKITASAGEDAIERCNLIRRIVYQHVHDEQTPKAVKKQFMKFLPIVGQALALAKYDPDYVREKPSVERLMETLFLFATQVNKAKAATILTSSKRQAHIVIGQEIEVKPEEKEAKGATSGQTAEQLTDEVRKQLLRLVTPSPKPKP